MVVPTVVYFLTAASTNVSNRSSCPKPRIRYVSGGELREYCEAHGPLSEIDSRVFFRQIIKAVHYSHSKKIIHRDLKLENILLDAQKRCKIVDFGLSDFVADAARTVTDAGTESYLAPEVRI